MGRLVWRLDESRLAPLRLSLALGLAAPAGPPRLATRAVEAEVLVAVSPGVDGEPFARDLHDALAMAGAGPHVVRVAAVGGESAGERLAALIARRRPLAVVLAPWEAVFGGGATTTDGAATGSTPQVTERTPAGALADELQAEAQALRRAWQPAVLVAPPAGAPDELADAASATGLPLVDPAPDGWPSFAAGDASVWSTRLIAAAVARACWPRYLAPGLAGTELGFSYAARRDTEVAIAGDASASLAPYPPAPLIGWLPACGYEVVAAAGAAWRAPAGDAIVYRPGARRAALTLAGDIGWGAGALVRDPSAPAEVTLSLSAD